MINKIHIKENKLLDSFYKYFDTELYNKAISALNKMEKNQNDSSWIFAKLAACKYELRNYKEAIIYCYKALEVQKNYPLALWTLGNSYYHDKQFEEAIKVFKTIAEMTEAEIGKIETTHGIVWARSLIMDCYIKLSDCYYMLEKDNEAKDSLAVFETFRKKKLKTHLSSWYVKEMRKKIREI